MYIVVSGILSQEAIPLCKVDMMIENAAEFWAWMVK